MAGAEPSLVQKILDVHAALDRAGIGHAFGGALALAFYTSEPRATADIDVNVELRAHDARRVFRALPEEVEWSEADVARVALDEQVRLWWGRTPLDLFFRASAFHDGVAHRTQWKRLAGTELPFLAALDLAVFKSLFDRPKDWLDIEAMCDAGALDPEAAAAALESLIGQDGRVARLRRLHDR